MSQRVLEAPEVQALGHPEEDAGDWCPNGGEVRVHLGREDHTFWSPTVCQACFVCWIVSFSHLDVIVL